MSTRLISADLVRLSDEKPHTTCSLTHDRPCLVLHSFGGAISQIGLHTLSTLWIKILVCVL